MNNGPTGLSAGSNSVVERCDPPQSVVVQQPHALRESREHQPLGGGAALSRRVTLGGRDTGYHHPHHGMMDPRGDMYGRGYDLDTNYFGRRDSLDSTTAVLDAAILDLTRRRLSMVGSRGGGMGGGMSMGGDASLEGGSRFGMAYGHTENLAARQAALMEQQLELERRQRALELQRQQLLAGMAEHARSSSMLAEQESGHMANGLQQQWWVCQVCNTRAFSSHEEAMRHEITCMPVNDASTSSRYDPLAFMAHDHMPSYAMAGEPLDASTHSGASVSTHSPTTTLSTGPFAMLSSPVPLAMPCDKDWLTPLHCFVRRYCVEVFCAAQGDVSTPSKGKRKPIQVGQIGIRCPHCYCDSVKGRERGSTYYPTSISSVYNATMNLLQRHLHTCPAMPEEIMLRYETLKGDDARSGTSKRYWVESALSLGLVDTANGIRFSALRPPPLPSLSTHQQDVMNTSVRRNSNDFFSNNSNADLNASTHSTVEAHASMPSGATSGTTEHDPSLYDSGMDKPLVAEDDKPHATEFSFLLLAQMRPCVFTEADRLGKRKGLPEGFPGLSCRHCFGGYGQGRFFPSSIKTLSDTSKTLNVLHNHMSRCRKCPQDIRDSLDRLRTSHDEERGKMKFGSQKAFFARIWERLHGTKPTLKRSRVDRDIPKKSPAAHTSAMKAPAVVKPSVKPAVVVKAALKPLAVVKRPPLGGLAPEAKRRKL